MSARQPFVPRPASRPSAAPTQTKDAVSQANPAFAVDPSNPLNRDFGQSSKPPASFMTNKPLNLSSFAKGDSGSSQSHSMQSPQNPTKPAENIIRPQTADILAQSRIPNPNQLVKTRNQMKIVAPTPASPFRSNASAIFSIDDSTFNPPAKSAPTSADESTEKNKRIITPDFSDISPLSDTSWPLLPVTPSPSKEQAPECANEDKPVDPPGFGVNTPRVYEGGPMRVLANSRLRTSMDSRSRNEHSIREQDENAGDKDEHSDRRLARHKRARPSGFHDNPEEIEYVGPAKKYKYQGKEQVATLGRQVSSLSRLS